MNSFIDNFFDSMTIHRICELVEKESGIHLDLSKEYLLKDRLAPFVQKHKFLKATELCNKIQISNECLQEVVELLTTNETYWFRDDHLWKIFQEKILSDYLLDIKEGKRRRVNVWCAATSTGQEPYSIAIAIKDEILRKNFNPDFFNCFSILATDISDKNLSFAKRGIYSKGQIDRGAKHKIDCYFKLLCNSNNNNESTDYQILPEVAKIVSFNNMNLMSAFHHQLKDIDIIFCRNVAIYFSDSVKKDLYEKLSKVLCNDGNLIVGSTEAIWENEYFIPNDKYQNVSYKKKLSTVKN